MPSFSVDATSLIPRILRLVKFRHCAHAPQARSLAQNVGVRQRWAKIVGFFPQSSCREQSAFRTKQLKAREKKRCVVVADVVVVAVVFVFRAFSSTGTREIRLETRRKRSDCVLSSVSGAKHNNRSIDSQAAMRD